MTQKNTANSLSITPIEIMRSFLNAFVVRRDAKTASELLADNIEWISTGEYGETCGREDAYKFMLCDIKANPAPYKMETIYESEQIIAEGVGNASFRGNFVSAVRTLVCRVTVSTCIENGTVKICSLHFSVPFSGRNTEDYLPYTVAEKHAQDLMNEYLNQSIICGVLSGYKEPSFPLYYISNRMLKILGFDNEAEYVSTFGGLVENGIHPDDRKSVVQSVEEQLARRGEYQVSYRLLKKDGSFIWVDDCGKAVKNGEQRDVIVSICLDVTERVQKKLEQERQQREISHIYNMIPGWIFTCEKDEFLTLQHSNPGIEAVLGYTAEEFQSVHGGRISEIFPEKASALIRKGLKELDGGVDNIHREVPVIHKDGSLRIVLCSVFKSVADGRDLLYVMCQDSTEKYNFKRELERKNAELNSVVNALTGGVAMYKITDKIECVYYSSGLKNLVGCTAKELERITKVNSLEYIFCGDKATVWEAVQQVVATLLPQTISFRLKVRSGKYIWVKAYISIAGERDGAPLVYAVLTNITEVNALYQDALDQTNEQIFICDYSTKELLFMNRSAENNGYYDKSKAVGMTCHKYRLNRDTPCDFCEQGRLDSDGFNVYEIELDGRYYVKKGKRINWNGREALIEYVTDITESYKESAKVMNDRDMLVTATRVMFPMCISVNLTQNSYYMIEYDTFNAKKAEKVGVFDELIEVGLSTIHDEDKELFWQAFGRENLLNAFERGERVVSQTCRQMGVDGKWHWNRTTVVFADKLYDGDVYEISLTDCLDDQKRIETDLQQALDEAKKANSAKDEFLARMSHDMRTPMNAILGLTDIARDKLGNPEAVGDYLDKIKSSGDFMLGLINDILDRAKIDDGVIVFNKEPYRYGEFLQEIETMFRPMCEKRGIEFEFEQTEREIVVFADKIRVNQIFFNILSNAVKFTDSGGKVSYRTENVAVEGNMLVGDYIVSDTGIGMSEEFQKNMFNPFTQENTNATSEFNGSGLGLGIAKSLAELMGGKLSVQSKIGVGTTITVHLAFEIAHGQSERESKISEENRFDERVLLGKRVLLVEDHPLNLMIAQKLLERYNMEVQCAVNGQQGVEMFEESPIGYYDLILMDIRMPIMDGLTASRTIRATDRPDARTVPIVAMTANAYDDDRQRSADAGMNEHLAKPVEPQKLYSTLCSLLGSTDGN